MSKPYVFISMKVPDEVLEPLVEVAEVHMWPETTPCPNVRLRQEAARADALFTTIMDRIDRDLLEQAPQLRLVANMAVGYDNIDASAASELGILVSNTPDVLTEATADLTFSLLMATARRLVEASGFLHAGKWKSWSPMLLAGQDIYGATLGIVGMGRIGKSIVKRARGFDMTVLYHNRSRKFEDEHELGVRYRPFDDLLAEADFVVCMTPLTKETQDMFGKREFSLMKKSACFINASRGGVVCEQDLYDALVQKEIWAAGLDVFAEEPVPTDHPLLSLDNVVALPHIGSATMQTRLKMGHLAAQNIIALLSGEKPPTLVNPSVWESRSANSSGQSSY